MFVKKLLCKFAFVPLITYTCHNLDQDPTRLKPCGIWGEDDVTWCMRRVVHVNKCCKHLNPILPHLDYITLAHNNHVPLFTIKSVDNLYPRRQHVYPNKQVSRTKYVTHPFY